MAVNLFVSRRGYNIKCKLYKIHKDNNTQQEYDDFPNEYFWAKQIQPYTDKKKGIEGFMQYRIENTYIETVDIVDIDDDDVIEFYDKRYRVVDTQKTMYKKQTEFSKNPTVRTIISLEGSK